MRRRSVVVALFLMADLALAGYQDDIGSGRLQAELSAAMPTGAGVSVGHVEAQTSWVDHDNNSATAELPVYLPDRSDPHLVDDVITDASDIQDYYGLSQSSGHATSVARRFYGTSSIAFDIDSVNAHWVSAWLEYGVLNYGWGDPRSTADRISNHSWIGSSSDMEFIAELLRRIDWLIDADEHLQVVGLKNSASTNSPLFSSAFNVISVGKSDGANGRGSPAVDSVYVAGRTGIDLVVSLTTSSAATPVAAAAAALLIETGHANPSLSTDPVEASTSNRAGATIYNAERSEVIKAALMAGADRYTRNSGGAANLADYRGAAENRSSNGLDIRYGAGQLNLYNSYYIIAAGEQNSTEDGGSEIGTRGFDYDPAFGGLGSNSVATYDFSTATSPVILTASLVWNISIDEGWSPFVFTGDAHLHDLDVNLYDVTEGMSLVLTSSSTNESTENLYAPLAPWREYRLQVVPKAGQPPFNWDYALAWQLELDQDGDVIGDYLDNCPMIANSDQADLDEDGMGDVCDPDIDGDGVENPLDAFAYDDTEWLDTDGDGIGNNADTDDDNDSLPDDQDPNPLVPEPDDTIDADVPFLPTWGLALFAGLLAAASRLSRKHRFRHRVWRPHVSA